MLAFFLCAGAVCSVSEGVVGGSEIIQQEEGMDMDSYYDDYDLTEKEIDDGDTQGSGQISGTVYGSDGWSTFPLPFALVQAGGKSDFTSITGHYVVNNLPLDVPLQVTANKYGWDSQTVQVTLTESSPMQTVNFVLDDDGSGGGFFKECYCEGSIYELRCSKIGDGIN